SGLASASQRTPRSRSAMRGCTSASSSVRRSWRRRMLSSARPRRRRSGSTTRSHTTCARRWARSRATASMMLEGLAGELPERARRFVENSTRAAANLLSLLNDLLDFAKLQANRVEVELSSTDLQRVVEDALLSVRPQAGENGL